MKIRKKMHMKIFIFDFQEEKVLQEYFIPDISDIITSYLSGPTIKFTKLFVEECVRNGDYLYYYDMNFPHKLVYESLIHYMLRKEYYYKVYLLLLNCKNISMEHFQNKNKKMRTELFLLCQHKAWDTIMLMPNLDIKYFMNKDKWKNTEFMLLRGSNNNIIINNIKNIRIKHIIPNINCNKTNLLSNTIIYNPQLLLKIPDIEYKHFKMDLFNGKTGVNYLCEYIYKEKNRNYIIGLIQKFKFTAEDYMSKDITYRKTALFYLCQNNEIDVIKLIPNLLPRHFTDRSLHNGTELYELCFEKRKEIIIMLSKKFTWKIEHCSSATEIEYLKSINIL